MINKKDIPLTEELDFHYLLSLMPPLSHQEGFEWLPELFSIIGIDSLILLSKYAGGETIRIPKLSELNDSIESLQWFYDVEIKKTKTYENAPKRILPLINTIRKTYYVDNNKEKDN